MDNGDYIIVKPWLDILKDRLDKKLTKMRIGYSDTLRRSIKGDILAASGGNVERVKLMYAYYGMFVDMGVGRGQKLGDVKDNASVNRLVGMKGRKPKKWVSKSLYAEVNILADLVMEHYAQQGLKMAVNLPRIVEM
jgi:hypothetical protein